MVKSAKFLTAIGLCAPLLFVAAPAHSQTEIKAPSGWRTQDKAGSARIFIPPNLAAGEVYSIAVYDSAALDGKTLEEYLRAFAGPVAKTPGKLAAPLNIKVNDGSVISGTGVYSGPAGKALGVMFLGVSLDGGKNIHVSRTLFSGQGDLLNRYQSANKAMMTALLARAKGEAGSNVLYVPAVVKQKLKPGGDLVPGVYAGNQYSDEELRYRFRIYIYANGEYRICDQNDKDMSDRYFDERTGQVTYNRNSGQLNIDSRFDLTNSRSDPDTDFCFYGRNSAGKPVIYAEEDVGFNTRRTLLTWVAPPTKRISKSAQEARDAAIEAEKKRYKFVTAPGKGVPNSQIAAIVHNYKVEVYSAGMSGIGTNVTDDAYLLLKNGTIHAGLPVPPDQLDVTTSRQKEPNTWGRWRLKDGKYQVSWDGGPYQALKGTKALPSPPQLRLAGRYGTGSSSANIGGSSYSIWGVTFDKSGRFIKDSRGGSANSTFMQSGGAPAINSTWDDSGSFTSASASNFVVSSSKTKQNPNAGRQGTYTLNGYTITLRYDNGKVTRLPFFFRDQSRKSIWFEGSEMSLDEKKK